MVLVKEWMEKSLPLIENGGKAFFLTKNKMFDSITKETRIYYKQVNTDDVLKTLKVRCDIINPKFCYTFWKTHSDRSQAERIAAGKLMTFSEKESLNKYMYNWLGNTNKKQEGFLQNMLERRTISTYNGIEFLPYLRQKGVPKLRDSFNTFTGYPMEDIELKQPCVRFEDSHLYKHLKEEMMNGNEGELNHFLDHIADMIQDPATIKTNGHLFYTKQGGGKGLLALFVSKLIGSDLTISFENTSAYFGKFNADQSNKLLKIFEEVSDKGSAFQNHNTLKGDQSKTSERVEAKLF